MLLVTLALVAAVNAATPVSVPAPPLPEPVSRNAQLLHALNQVDDDFSAVQKELGLVGSAPLTGLKSDSTPVKPSTSRTTKARVQKVSTQTKR